MPRKRPVPGTRRRKLPTITKMELIIPSVPPTVATADLAFFSKSSSVLLLKDDSLWIYERPGNNTRRTTPTVLAAAAKQQQLINDLHIKWPGITPIRSKTPLFIQLYNDYPYTCINCGNRTSAASPCMCEINTTLKKCTHCAMGITSRNNCSQKHCVFCCDCWYMHCGCRYPYEHNAKNQPAHYYWTFGDTMHAALTCGSCHEHCMCFFCECGSTHIGIGKHATCADCRSNKHATTCCSQRNRRFAIQRAPRLSFRNYASPLFYESKTFTKNECQRFLSPEIEIAEIQPTDWRYLVSVENVLARYKVPIVPELSIPNGFELNMPPANGDVFIKNLECVLKSIQKIHPYISNRCGLHVHVDARDYTIDDLAKFLYLWCKIEPLIYQLVEPFRRTVKFCVPSSKAYSQFGRENLDIEKLKQFLYGGGYDYQVIKQQQKKNTSSQEIRYRGINLHSFFYRGTIEFRHHQGSANAEEITSWALLCGFLLDAPKTMTWRLLSEITDKITTPSEFARGVLQKLHKDVPNIDLVLPIVKERYAQWGNAEETDEEAPEIPPRMKIPPRRLNTMPQVITTNQRNWIAPIPTIEEDF